MKHNRKPVIYVSGPLTLGDPILNTREALLDAEEIIAEGGIPIVPHMTILWHLLAPHDWQYWMDYDFGILKVVDATYRRPGKSNGGDLEVADTKEQGKPVFFDKESRKCWIEAWNLASRLEAEIEELEYLANVHDSFTTDLDKKRSELEQAILILEAA